MTALERLPFDLASLHAAYAQGVDPARVVEEAYRRIEAANDPGIFLHLVEPRVVIEQARALGPFDPERRPLHGLPFAIKDNIDAAGAPTTAACAAFAYEPGRDAFVVGALRRAGALLVGKTNLDQFATGLVGLRTPYPAPRNAHDPALIPGGSSSGSAVAVARGLVSFALGTDTAGSGRVPAAMNAIVGLKPTLGALSSRGVVPACRTLDTVCVFALCVEDAYAAFRCAALHDGEDPFARPVRAALLGPRPPRTRLGVPDPASREFFGDRIQAASFEAALEALAALGGEIVPLDLTPFYRVAELLYEGAWVAERYTVVESLLREAPDALHPVTAAVVGRAETLSAADAFRDLYRLRELSLAVAPQLDAVDALCVPSVPTLYSVADVEADPIGVNSRLGTYTNFVNLLDLCGIAVPVAPRADGRPASVTLLARAGRDAGIAALASALHAASRTTLGATGWTLCERPAPAPDPAHGAAADEIALAVVGAHMSGLPLNAELTALGGRFLRGARTAPDYRLFRLAGGPPLRPGLVRAVGDAPGGAAIELEIWALPIVRLGEFLAGVPRPLAIGTVELDDGGEVKGFLCEATGLEGAQEITALGGWRPYLARLEG